MGESFGEALRKARESAGLEIRQLSEITRIQPRYLEALEAENWAALPSGVIGRGFVRVVARELHVPPDDLLQRYRASRGKEDLDPGRQLPEADWEVDLRKRRRVAPLLVAVMALVVAGLAAWLWAQWKTRPAVVSPPQSAEPQRSAGTPPAPASPSDARPPADTPVSAPVVEPPAAPRAGAPPAGSGPETQGGPAREMRVEIRAVDKVWVRAIADGGESQIRLLQPGETLSVTGTKGIEVRLGSAGAARISWNGEELRPAGRVGQAVTLRFPADAEALKR